MKKRFLSCFMALALCLTLLPAAALAEETEGTAQTPPAMEKAVDPANGGAKQESQPAAPKQENQSAEQEEQQEDSAAKQAVATVQALIDALPSADELPGMDDKALDAVYEAFQAACGAYYDTLTEEQQAQLKNTEKLAALSDWFSQPAALADGTEENIYYTYDSVDENGNITQGTASLTGPLLTENDKTLSGQYYIVQGNMIIDGNLTVDGSQMGGLVLCAGATLTVTGALIHNGGSSFGIYGTSNNGADAGELVINNSLDNGAAIRTGSTSTPQLNIYSGEVTINAGKSGKLVEGVELYSTNKIHAATLDAKKVLPAEWRGVSSIKGTSLVLEYCDHDDADTVWIKDDDTQHHWQCKACGFEGGVEACFTNTTISGITPNDNGTHTWKCICGREKNGNCSYVSLSTPKATPDGKGHTAIMCSECGSPEDKAEAHTYDAYGKCTACTFEPLAKDEAGDLYGRTQDHSDVSLDVNDALAEGHTITLWRPDTVASKTIQGIYIDFDAAGKSATLDMNGYSLETSTGGATITVENGTLTVKGDATLVQNGTQELASSAVRVTGGTLIFEGNLTATGASGKPAVEVTNGTLRLKAGDVLNGGVSVEGSENYETVNALLGENLAFAKKDDTSTIVNGNVKSITENVTVVTHPHSFTLDSDGKYTCVCGYTCPHNNFKDGKCTICGNGCAHTDVDDGGVCRNCKTQMAVKSETGGTVTYGTDFKAAMKAAEDGTTVTLLADIEWGVTPQDRAAITGDGKIVTLNLNGHTITGGWFDIGSNNNPTSCTLKIIGEGSHKSLRGSGGYSGVSPKATLDLSKWEGGTISTINISDSSNYEAETREAAVIVGPKAGTIGKLTFGNNQLPKITKTKLSGGSFNEIWAANNQPVKLGELLADGYAFQNGDGSYVEYTTTLQNASIFNVKVVPCPHADAEGGKCLYCGQTGILARVGNTTYDDVSKAVSAWLANGGTLKLYADAGDRSNVDFSSGADKPFVIDLNGFAFNKDGAAITLGGGKALTITDSSGKGTGVFGPVTADRGTLTLESGCLEKLTVPSSSTAKILLKGGKLTGIWSSVPVFNLLPNGYALMDGSGLPVDPTIMIGDSKTYTVKDSTNRCISSQKEGSAAIGSDTIPFALSLETADSEIGKMGFTWYIVKEDGTTQELAATTSDVTPGTNGVYTCNAANMTVDPNGWSGLEANKPYNVLCVVNGKTSDGTSKWQTPMRGYKLTVTPADLSQGAVVFTQVANEYGAMGNIGDGKGTFVFAPWNGNTDSATELSYLFEVSCNGRTLTADSDYTVTGGSTAKWAGTYTLTIEGKGNYTGTAAHQWEIKPYTLSKDRNVARIVRAYDGTTNLSAEDLIELGCFSENLENRNSKNPSLGADQSSITIRLGAEDFEVSNVKLSSAEAGDTTASFTIKLKPRPGQTAANFVFEDGTSEMTVKEVSVSTREAFLSSSPKAGKLNVANDHAGVYTLDLSKLLPKLESPKEYGKVTYALDTVSINGGYYDAAKGSAEVKDGKLILPIQAVKTSTESNIGTVKVKVTSGNIVDFPLLINVDATNKIIPTGEPTLSKNTLAWGEQLSTITLSGTMTDPTDSTKTVKGKFEWVTPGAAKEKIGEYEAAWKFTPDENAVYTEAAGTVTITVTKATPKGAPDYTKITTGGKTLKDANLTVGTIQPEGTIQWEQGDTTVVTANTAYKWVFIPNDDAHYNELTGSITPYSVSSSSGGGGGSDSNPVIKTETKNHPDGSTTKTETRRDGSVTQTTTGKDGSVSKTETKPNGSSVTENKAADGSTGTVKTDKNGQTEAKTALSNKAIEDAKKNGEAVKAPVEVEASRNSNTAPTVKVELPKGAGETKVEIPVSNVKPGTVAVLVHPDGTEEIVKNSLPTEDGIQLTVNGNATVKIVDNSKDFIDTQDHWAKDAIDFVSARGLVNGMSATIYAPNASTTRAQLWTILARQNDANLNGGSVWYEKAQNWAKDKGVSDGANPNAAINRAQMVTMLWRTMGQPAAGGAATFTDVPADSYYASAVAWAVENGITTGVGGGKFDPNTTCTRAQIAAFLYRYMK